MKLVRQMDHYASCALILLCVCFSLTAHAQISAGTDLGTFTLFAESASQGNALTILYGKSVEGANLITYWTASPSFQVLSMGNAKYEIAEIAGGRCLTAAASTLTLQTCVGGASQLFTLTAQADGSYVVQSGLGTCLYAPGAFATTTMATCNAVAGEKWKFSGSTLLSLAPAAKLGVATTTSSIVPSPTVPTGYKLTFDDEFTTLNISDVNGSGAKWFTHTVQCCMSDTSKPSTPTYMAGIRDGVGKDPYSLVSGGGLDIRLQKTNGAWYSGVISTVDNTGTGFSQKYGYFEMKAKFPNAAGTWPAFWLLNANHLSQSAPAGEIDVVESYMFTPNVVNTTLHDWNTGTQVGYKWSQVSDLTVGFHTFGMLWTASTMTFYVDNVIVYELATPSIMQQPYYPIIDLGLGGGFPTSQTPQSSDMIVQYMRVYQAP